MSQTGSIIHIHREQSCRAASLAFPYMYVCMYCDSLQNLQVPIEITGLINCLIKRVHNLTV